MEKTALEQMIADLTPKNLEGRHEASFFLLIYSFVGKSEGWQGNIATLAKCLLSHAKKQSLPCLKAFFHVSHISRLFAKYSEEMGEVGIVFRIERRPSPARIKILFKPVEGAREKISRMQTVVESKGGGGSSTHRPSTTTPPVVDTLGSAFDLLGLAAVLIKEGDGRWSGRRLVAATARLLKAETLAKNPKLREASYLFDIFRANRELLLAVQNVEVSFNWPDGSTHEVMRLRRIGISAETVGAPCVPPRPALDAVWILSGENLAIPFSHREAAAEAQWEYYRGKVAELRARGGSFYHRRLGRQEDGPLICEIVEGTVEDDKGIKLVYRTKIQLSTVR